MITTGKIEFGKEVRTPRAVEQRVDVRQRLDRRARDGVEAPVVVADAPRPVRLTREHHHRRVPGRRVLDPAAVEHVDELRAQLRCFTGRDRGIGPGTVHAGVPGSWGVGAAGPVRTGVHGRLPSALTDAGAAPARRGRAA